MVRSASSRRHPVLLALYATAVLLVPLGVAHFEVDPRSASSSDTIDESTLSGLWSAYEPGGEGDPVGFYYFHGDGKGLYRYGRVGLNNTHSFDYELDSGRQGSSLVLHFRKTGATHRVPIRIDSEGGRDRLTLLRDPEAEGQERRYVRQRGPVEESLDVMGDGPLPAGRLWIDYRDFATGGSGFDLYQLRPAGLDGRGVGWFHRGDFDDWSTESLHYRITGDRMEIWFDLAGQHANTGFRIEGEGRERSLFLETDPRDFWHSHRYHDGGRSFGEAALGLTWMPALGLLR